jgi:hypothetical protein
MPIQLNLTDRKRWKRCRPNVPANIIHGLLEDGSGVKKRINGFGRRDTGGLIMISMRLKIDGDMHMAIITGLGDILLCHWVVAITEW